MSRFDQGIPCCDVYPILNAFRINNAEDNNMVPYNCYKTEHTTCRDRQAWIALVSAHSFERASVKDFTINITPDQTRLDVTNDRSA